MRRMALVAVLVSCSSSKGFHPKAEQARQLAQRLAAPCEDKSNGMTLCASERGDQRVTFFVDGDDASRLTRIDVAIRGTPEIAGPLLVAALGDLAPPGAIEAIETRLTRPDAKPFKLDNVEITVSTAQPSVSVELAYW